MSFQKFAAATILLAVPIFTVQSLKKTSWGELKATPVNRQKGEPSAKLLIVEYSDFQCPMCAHVQPAIHQFLESYKGKVRLLYKYYPLTKAHPNAMPAAHAAECASEQKQFWPYHDQLFAKQDQWAKLTNPTTTFMVIGESVSLDMEKFKTCYEDPTKRIAIEADMREAKSRAVNATPTFFIGDERLVGNPFMTEGARTIEKKLREIK